MDVTYQAGEASRYPEEHILHFARVNEVYKVCRVADDGTLRSAAMSAEASQYGFDLEYPLNEEVHAPEGTVGIFCFPDLACAEKFTRRMSITAYNKRVIVRCTTTHAPRQLWIRYGMTWVRLWRKKAHLLLLRQFNELGIYSTPNGTCVVPSLTPIERITT